MDRNISSSLPSFKQNVEPIEHLYILQSSDDLLEQRKEINYDVDAFPLCCPPSFSSQ